MTIRYYDPSKFNQDYSFAARSLLYFVLSIFFIPCFYKGKIKLMDTTQIAMPCFFLTFQSSKLISDMSFESILTSIY